LIKISRVEAYQSFSEVDLTFIDMETERLFKARGDKDMTIQYFADETRINLKVYYDDEEVASYGFMNKVGLTERGERVLKMNRIKAMDNELNVSHKDVVRLLEKSAELEVNETDPDMKNIYKVARMELYKMMKFE